MYLGPFGDASGWWFDKRHKDTKRLPMPLAPEHEHMTGLTVRAGLYSIYGAQVRHGNTWSKRTGSNQGSNDEGGKGNERGGGKPETTP
ncbi:hypothetical protein [Streptomyces sp. H27-D2]|uniref:hypothetical protein n=1 Tax=Streptomyces sp. H27-D2 TaxID=3046304 RepID=UPI002DBA525F|nr:hypothetical protein [Streptomyces sp. H27-D2]MEC4015371.1 hypothetical protein [Streptomyces sp. H27-D2]